MTRNSVSVLALASVALCLQPARAFNVVANLFDFAPACGHGGRTTSAMGVSSLAYRSRAGVKGLKASAGQPSKVDLPTGVSMEYFSMPAKASSSSKAPIVFIHGSFHGGWCWAEHWMSYLSQQRGYDTYAVSLRWLMVNFCRILILQTFVVIAHFIACALCRGTSGTPLPAEAAAAGVKVVQMSEHVADIAAFIETVIPKSCPPPVLVGHSFGGMYVQKFVEVDAKPVSAAVMMCSVPPSGNAAIVSRFIRTKPLLALDIVRGLVLKQAGTNIRIARRLFFADASPTDEEVIGYMENFKVDGVVTLDVGKAIKEFPTKTCSSDDGKAEWLGRAPPLMVLGAEDDQIVDRLGVEETAAFYNVQPVWVKQAHDVMLGSAWQEPANVLGNWLDENL